MNARSHIDARSHLEVRSHLDTRSHAFLISSMLSARFPAGLKVKADESEAP